MYSTDGIHSFSVSDNGLDVSDTGFLYFGSGSKAPFHQLSNFALIEPPLYYNGNFYSSAEHALQACLDAQNPGKYTTNGIVGKPTSQAFARFFPANVVQKKMDWWMKKKNVGILAKMEICLMKKGGMKKKVNGSECFELWMPILRAKFNREEFKQILLSTDNRYLVEFARGGKKKTSRWGGLVVNNRVVGHNQMGVALMQIKKELQEKEARALTDARV